MSCSDQLSIEEVNNIGYAQGTTFQIKYLTIKGRSYKSSIDSILNAVDKSMSTYLASSTIAKVNRVDSFVIVDDMFLNVLKAAKKISKKSNGAFDVSIGALSEAWGFGVSKSHDIDSMRIDSIRRFVNYNEIEINSNLVRTPFGMKLDFNAIAQGYSVDVIASFLQAKGIANYMVEVGGEVRAHGVNGKGEVWRIGVDKPSEELDENDRFQMILELKDAGLATSGNYRKFWIDDSTGIKYAHTIDPRTGYPARNRLLSVTTIAEKTMDADAYATLFMVVGLEKSLNILKSQSGVEAYFIFTDEKGEWEIYQTEGFENYLVP